MINKTISIKDSLVEIKNFIKRKICSKEYCKFDYLFSTSSREIIDILKKNQVWSVGAQLVLYRLTNNSHLLVLRLLAHDGQFVTGMQISHKYETINILRGEYLRNILSQRNIQRVFKYSQR